MNFACTGESRSPQRSRGVSALGAATIAALLVLGPAAGRGATPSNAAAGYTLLDLYSNRLNSAGINDNINLSVYPAYLTSPSLLVTRSSTDTVGLFNSQPNRAVNFEANGGTPASYVTFLITLPQYATSIGTLSMGYELFNGTGGFADCGKPLLRTVVTYADGDSATSTLSVCSQLRDWANAGPAFCPDAQPPAISPPTDPLAGVVYQQASPGFYYDVQELRLPPQKRNKRVSTLRVQGVLLDHLCSISVPHLYAGSYLCGLSLWPNFSVVNRAGQSIAPQFQNDGSWANTPYGGYLYGGSPVGSWRFMKNTGCFVSCLSMLNNYFGATGTTPASLNL